MISTSSNPSPDFRRLITEELPGLKVHALRLCKDTCAAADLVQDTVERALSREATFAPGTHLKQWLHTILRNLFTDGWRRSNIYREVASDFRFQRAPDPWDRALSRWREVGDDELRAAMDQLPDRLRTAFELHVTEGLPYHALAARLGVKRSTVGTRLLRARRFLLKVLSAPQPAVPTGSRRPGSAPAAPSIRAQLDRGSWSP
jgi:RNA polymerase sigma-70 factor, ECF subfamily